MRGLFGNDEEILELYAEVIINNKCRETDKAFNYVIPPEFRSVIKPGCRVIVPFGRSNKGVEGYVLSVTDKLTIDKKRLKCITKPLDDYPVMSPWIIELAKWMRDKYLCFYVDAIQAVVPTPIRTRSSVVIELCDDYEEVVAKNLLSTVLMSEILEYLEGCGKKVGLNELKSYFGSSPKCDYALNKLLGMGILKKHQQIKSKIGIRTDSLLYAVEDAADKLSKRASKQLEVLELIAANPGIASSKLKEGIAGSSGVIKQLLDKGLIREEVVEDFREIGAKSYADKRHQLTEEQHRAMSLIEQYFSENRNVLLHGVTGSGKTEIYLEIIEKYLQQGKDSIVLVPEISLTPQMIGRFKGRFGDNVAVLHSSLSEGEKFDEWRKIRSGLVKVAIGARSAVFAPFSNLGIIIIDEEHETTYKSDLKPKYFAREVAEKRCEVEGAHMILGSATPAIETYYKASIGEYGLVELLNRANGRPMPDIEIIDMREELKGGNKSIFSSSLTEGILEVLKKEDQLILFLNRRGYSTFVSCRDCGLVLKCPRCSISMTYHLGEDRLNCHYCGYERENPSSCPKCQSKNIKYFGIGTQRVEKEFHKKFGISNTLRMDADTTTRKNSHENILDRFRKKESKVLLGTQMISKGLDFPDVTLVGVVAADTSLNLPDFRSAEKTFQMIAQVAGRSGRGEKQGRVVVQTYSPEHYSIQYASTHDYKGFYAQEIKLRKELGYPPFYRIANIIISGIQENQVIKSAQDIGRLIEQDVRAGMAFEMLGPVTAPLSKIKNRFRWQIVLKSAEEEVLRKVLKGLIDLYNPAISDINISIDLNPQNML